MEYLFLTYKGPLNIDNIKIAIVSLRQKSAKSEIFIKYGI